MVEETLIQARKRAEQAVSDMKEGPLKVAAFQTILAKLLDESYESGAIVRRVGKPAPSIGKQSATLSGRILAIRSEGFFGAQRSLGEVRQALGSKGWHYPLTTMSGAMQGLVRKRELRRERVSEGKKTVWKYCNP